MRTTAFISGLLLAIAASGVSADEKFSTLTGIPAEAMSHGEMDKVEGKGFFDNWTLAEKVVLVFALSNLLKPQQMVTSSFSSNSTQTSSYPNGAIEHVGNNTRLYFGRAGIFSGEAAINSRSGIATAFPSSLSMMLCGPSCKGN